MAEAEQAPLRLAGVRQESGTVIVTLDSGETLELAPESVPGNLPAVGESISSPLLHEIRQAAERKQIARRLFRLLDRRLQPVARLRDKLLDDGCDETALDDVLEQMARQGLYSDRVYAEAWCRDTLLSKAVGRRYLVDKLWRKRVPRHEAEAAVGAVLSPEHEQELAEQAAADRWRRIRGDRDRKAEAKVIRFLLGRGFSPQQAYQAAQQSKPDR